MISVLTNLSPLKRFMSAVIPGLLYAAAMMLVALAIGRRRSCPTAERVDAAGLWRAFLRAICALAMPVLYPIAAKFGVDPCHFSMIVGLNLVIGLITPPVAICLSIGALIARAPADEVNREALPFLAAAFGVVLLVTYVPALSTWLPSVVGGR